MPTTNLLVVTYVLSGIWWFSPTINAAKIFEGPHIFQAHNKFNDVKLKCQKGKTSLAALQYCTILET